MRDSERYVLSACIAACLGLMAAVQISLSSRRPAAFLWVVVKYPVLRFGGWFFMALGLCLIGGLILGDNQPWWFCLVGSSLANLIGWYYARTLNYRAAEIMQIDYEKKFPTGCVTCAWLAYGIENGFIEWPEIPEHEHERARRARGAKP